MSKTQTIKIMFPKGGTIPKSVLKSGKDLKVSPMVGVTVPVGYGQQLIDDKFVIKFNATDGVSEVSTSTVTKLSAKDTKALADFAEGKKTLADDQSVLLKGQTELKVAQEKLAQDVTDFDDRMRDELKKMSDDRDAVSEAEKNFNTHVSTETERLDGIRGRLADLATLTASASSEEDTKAVAAAAKEIETALSPKSDA